MYPHERSLVENLKDKPFSLLGINSDPDKEALRQHMQDEQITWRSFWDQTTSGPIATKWRVSGWPTLYLLDHEGVIRQKWVGSPGDEAIDKAIEELLVAAEAAAGSDAKKAQ